MVRALKDSMGLAERSDCLSAPGVTAVHVTEYMRVRYRREDIDGRGSYVHNNSWSPGEEFELSISTFRVPRLRPL